LAKRDPVSPRGENDRLRTGLTYDDVLLIPRYSRIRSRQDVSTATKLTPKISLSIPIVSANMDTVTEAEMAVALAREGGIGIIHRFMSLEEQTEQVRRVKRMESILIESPYTLEKSATLADVRRIMREKSVGGILVVDNDNTLEGIVTTRDIRFLEDPKIRVNDIMTKRKDLVAAPWGKTAIEEARKIMEEQKVEKLPLVDAKGKLRGLVTAKDILKRKEFPNATKDSKGRLRAGAAIGVKGDFLDRAKKLFEADCDVLVLDIAHGHSEHAIDAVRRIKKLVPEAELIAGNVATPEGAIDLIKAGADAIKVGVGSGSICITRIVTGSGVPQLTALLDCAEVIRKAGATMIADGGTRNSGDITKALAAGADSVMIGSLLAGTDESPGQIVFRGSHRYKVTRGMASATAQRDRLAREGKLEAQNSEVDLTDYVPEGVEAIVPYKGAATSVVRQLVGGLRSGLSYCGASDLQELRDKARFIKMTEVGLSESMPHDVITEL
jgi:IMP dehydrogenase